MNLCWLLSRNRLARFDWVDPVQLNVVTHINVYFSSHVLDPFLEGVGSSATKGFTKILLHYLHPNLPNVSAEASGGFHPLLMVLPSVWPLRLTTTAAHAGVDCLSVWLDLIVWAWMRPYGATLVLFRIGLSSVFHGLVWRSQKTVGTSHQVCVMGNVTYKVMRFMEKPTIFPIFPPFPRFFLFLS